MKAVDREAINGPTTQVVAAPATIHDLEAAVVVVVVVVVVAVGAFLKAERMDMDCNKDDPVAS